MTSEKIIINTSASPVVVSREDVEHIMEYMAVYGQRDGATLYRMRGARPTDAVFKITGDGPNYIFDWEEKTLTSTDDEVTTDLIMVVERTCELSKTTREWGLTGNGQYIFSWADEKVRLVDDTLDPPLATSFVMCEKAIPYTAYLGDVFPQGVIKWRGSRDDFNTVRRELIPTSAKSSAFRIRGTDFPVYIEGRDAGDHVVFFLSNECLHIFTDYLGSEKIPIDEKTFNVWSGSTGQEACFCLGVKAGHVNLKKIVPTFVCESIANAVPDYWGTPDTVFEGIISPVPVDELLMKDRFWSKYQEAVAWAETQDGMEDKIAAAKGYLRTRYALICEWAGAVGSAVIVPRPLQATINGVDIMLSQNSESDIVYHAETTRSVAEIIECLSK